MTKKQFCVNCGGELTYIRGDIWNCEFCSTSFNLNNLRMEQEHEVLDYVSSLRTAIRLFNDGQEIEASKRLQKMTTEFYDRDEVWMYLGHTYLIFKRPEFAMNSFEEVLKLDNFSEEIYFHIALVYEYNKDYKKAIEMIEKGLSYYEEPMDYRSFWSNENRICRSYFYNKSTYYVYYGWYEGTDSVGKRVEFSKYFEGTYQEFYVHCILLAIKDDNLKLATKYIKYALKKRWLHKSDINNLCVAKKLKYHKYIGLTPKANIYIKKW